MKLQKAVLKTDHIFGETDMQVEVRGQGGDNNKIGLINQENTIVSQKAKERELQVGMINNDTTFRKDREGERTQTKPLE